MTSFLWAAQNNRRGRAEMNQIHKAAQNRERERERKVETETATVDVDIPDLTGHTLCKKWWIIFVFEKFFPPQKLHSNHGKVKD